MVVGNGVLIMEVERSRGVRNSSGGRADRTDRMWRVKVRKKSR